MKSGRWRVSSYSGNQGNCVEVKFETEGVLVRDTKDRSKPPHRYTPDEWDAFIKGVKAGEFDR